MCVGWQFSFRAKRQRFLARWLRDVRALLISRATLSARLSVRLSACLSVVGSARKPPPPPTEKKKKKPRQV